MDEKKQFEDDLEDNLNSTEFDDMYSETDDILGDEEIDSDLEGMDEDLDSGAPETDLDFIEEDIEEIYSDETVEETVATDEDDFQNYQNPPVKKKSSIGTIAVLLLLIGGGGAGAYFSGLIPGVGPSAGTRSYQVPTDTDIASQDQSEDSLATESVEAEESTEGTDAAGAGELQDLYEENFDEFSEYDETATSNGNSNAGFIGSDELDMPEQTGATNATEELFADEQSPVEEAEPVMDIVVAEPVAQVNDMSAQSETLMNSDEINQIENRIAGFETQMQQMQNSFEAKISSLQSSLNNISARGIDGGAAASNVDLSGVENDISAVRQSIEKLNSRLDQFESKLNSGLAEMENAKSTQVAAPAPKKAEPVKAVELAPKKVAAPAPQPKAGISASAWEIRAIQVGKAVIARKGMGETRDIQVGDSVPGLGTVRDINYKNGGWVIEGSGGTIKQ